MNNLKFEDLNLSPEMLKSIKESGYETPTTIAAQAIPLGLDGGDFIGQSQTLRTGKTMAFSIPIVERIDKSVFKPQAIILCPTRELAWQYRCQMKSTKYASSLK